MTAKSYYGFLLFAYNGVEEELLFPFRIQTDLVGDPLDLRNQLPVCIHRDPQTRQELWLIISTEPRPNVICERTIQATIFKEHIHLEEGSRFVAVNPPAELSRQIARFMLAPTSHQHLCV